MELLALVVVAMVVIVALEAVGVVAALRLAADLYDRVRLLERVRPGNSAVPERVGDAELRTLEGERVKLSDLWAEGPILLVLAAVGCVACRDTLRSLADAYERLAQKGLRTVIVTAGQEGMVRYFIEDAAIPAAVRVSAVEEEKLRDLFPIEATPTFVAVGRGGAVRRVWVNPNPRDLQRDLLTVGASG